MAHRGNHYDAAFEAYLRAVRVPFVTVDEKRRSLMGDHSLKSMDYIVYSSSAENLLVDVKGRRFPTANGHRWESWAMLDDLQSLKHWENVFGDGFRSALVFAYHVTESRCLTEFETVFLYQQRFYTFFGVWTEDYRRCMTTRSPRWETVSIPARQFRQIRHPLSHWIQPIPHEHIQQTLSADLPAADSGAAPPRSGIGSTG